MRSTLSCVMRHACLQKQGGCRTLLGRARVSGRQGRPADSGAASDFDGGVVEAHPAFVRSHRGLLHVALQRARG